MTESKRTASVKETGKELPQEQWERFEAAVDAAVKSGPKHKRSAADKNERPEDKTGVEKG